MFKEEWDAQDSRTRPTTVIRTDTLTQEGKFIVALTFYLQKCLLMK